MNERLKADAGQGAAVRFVDGYLAYLLARASHLISGEFHKTLARQRILVMHWRILVILSDGPLSVMELARVALNKQPTVSRAVDRVERLGLLKRATDVADRRSIRVSITPKGRRLVRKLMEQAKTHEAAVLAPLGTANARTLLTMLQKLIELHQPGH